MRTALLIFTSSVTALSAFACAAAADDFEPGQIVALERAALERWGKGDPTGYFESFAPEITYFDPTTPSRIDGRDAGDSHQAADAALDVRGPEQLSHVALSDRVQPHPQHEARAWRATTLELRRLRPRTQWHA